ncbi:MAG: serine/threonine protein kinase [Myxococcales bacterium]|nr:serine/threonine protein kinase [Myxococcales bacterium]
MAGPPDEDIATAALATSRSAADDRVDAPAPSLAPSLAGRYSLVRKLGEGGMGEVYVAYDEQLDRRVAMKLLRPALAGPGEQQRMLREAQALARLSHPHVVQVHDVGTLGERLFVAMELVVGADLRKWWRAAPRTWRDVLERMLQAGEGLAAAHQAGLVHRDIKPDNILVGDDGRVRVADFGLARAEHDERDAPTVEPRVHGSLLDTPLTERGQILGTPAYMAPEQFLRQPADHRSDLFAFCVVLYEGVYGERPFRGRTWQELAAATLAGGPAPPAREPPVPAWLARAIARGLAVDLGARWPDMPALLAALRGPLQATRRRWRWAFGLTAVGLAAGLVVGAAASGRAAPCADAEAPAAALWTAERRAAVHAALLAVSPAAGAEISSRLDARLDRHVAALGDMSRETCLSHQRGELSTNLFERALACQDRRRRELDALLTLLAGADGDVAARALAAVDGLRDLAACRDSAALLAAVAPPDPAIAAAVGELDAALDRARALRLAGRYAAADAAIVPLVADAEALAYPPSLAEARTERGVVASELDRDAAAAEDLAAAAALAESVGADELRLAAMTAWLRAIGRASTAADVARVDAPLLARVDALGVLEPHVLALVERRGERLQKPHGLALLAAGEAWLERERLDRAHDRLSAAADIFAALGEAAAPELGETLNDLAMIASAERRYTEAHGHYQRAREILEQALGPHHPNLAFVAHNEARLFDKQGDFVAARTRYTAALALWDTFYGPDHPNTVTAVSHLARVSERLGDLDAAVAHAGRALASRERTLGPAHVGLASPLLTLTRVERRRGDLARARAHSDRALALLADAGPGDRGKLLDLLGLAADIATAEGRGADALAHHVRRLELTTDAATRGQIQLAVADLRWSAGDLAGARAAAEAARAGAPTDADTWLVAHPPPPADRRR